MSKRRTVTLTELLGVFAASLVALTPFAERLSIPWRDGESYDDWDAIAEALWMSFVVSTMADALSTGSVLNLPRYGFSYDEYPFKDMLIVSAEGSELLVVQQIVLDGTPASGIKVARVRLSDRKRIAHEVVRLDSPAWLLRFRADGSEERTREISLP